MQCLNRKDAKHASLCFTILYKCGKKLSFPGGLGPSGIIAQGFVKKIRILKWNAWMLYLLPTSAHINIFRVIFLDVHGWLVWEMQSAMDPGRPTERRGPANPCWRLLWFIDGKLVPHSYSSKGLRFTDSNSRSHRNGKTHWHIVIDREKLLYIWCKHNHLFSNIDLYHFSFITKCKRSDI